MNRVFETADEFTQSHGEFGFDGFGRGFVIEVIHFLRVIDEVKKLPLVFPFHLRVVDEFVGRGPDADHLGEICFTMAVEVVVGSIADFFRLSFENGLKAVALDVFWHGKTSVIEEGGSQVNMINHRVVNLPRLNRFGISDQERLMEWVFIHPLFVVEAVFTERKPLVGGVDDNGVFGKAALVEIVEDTADVVVHGLHQAVISLDVNLIEFGEHFLVRDIGVVDV